MELMADFFCPDNQDENKSSNPSLDLPDCLPPECADGNVEYKLKLVNPSRNRFEHLVTQMKWRLREGQGEAIYEIGVEDKGMLVGLKEEEINASLHTLYLMAEKLGASISILREKVIEDNDFFTRKAIEVLVRKVPDDQQSIELRISCLGNVDVGKSTLLGVLTQGEADNGRGSARLNLFRHRHEIQSGRTSSISREILGFNVNGSPVTYSTCRTAEEICEASSKLITFIDLAGHQKYLRTTVFGLMGHLPHFTMLLISAVSGLAGTTREHLGLALALDVPIIIIVNKIDLASTEMLENTISSLESLLKSAACKKVPLRVKTDDDAITAASSMTKSNVTPIFSVSCVAGHGLKRLYMFLNVLPPFTSNREREKLTQMNTEFQVDETFHVTDVGTVVGGLLVSGVVRENDILNIGPNEDGKFYPIQVSSVYRHKIPCQVVRSGESATLGLNYLNTNFTPHLRKGMVIISHNLANQNVCLYFQAKIHVLSHPTTIYPGFQATIHVGNIRQTAVIVAIMGKKGITTNETASCMFRFMKHPEFLHNGSRLLFRQGFSKGIGQIVQIFPVAG